MRSPVPALDTLNSNSKENSHAGMERVLSFIPKPLLDTDEAASVMRIHPKTLQKLARRGAVHGIRVGKLWRFRVSDIQEWIASQ